MFSKKIKVLKKSYLKNSDFWLYASGMNVERRLRDKTRINEEIYDLKLMVKSGVKTIILNHQGDYKKKTSKHTQYLSSYLEKTLKTKVYYVRKVNRISIDIIKKKLKPGEIAMLGNTRLFKGEQENSNKLSRFYSTIAKKILVGGFCKIHRKHASNYGVTKILDTYVSNGILNEIKKLNKWKKIKKNKVAILGGVKKEKILRGIEYFSKKYTFILPTGIFLNVILKCLNYKIGKSISIHDPKINKKILKLIKSKLFEKKFVLPDEVQVYQDKNKKITTKKIENVGLNDIICGIKITSKIKNFFSNAKNKKSVFLIAGTPDYIEKKVNDMCLYIKKFLNRNKINYFILGGDTANYLGLKNNISSGGGASLEYLSGKKIPLFELLKKKVND